jgi:RimJ/RimL family protein N-acetyltransferase
MSPTFPSFLATPRLLLRRLRREDGEALCGYRSRPEVARYQGWESYGPEDARRLIEDQQDAEPGIPGTWFQVVVVERATNVVIGDCGLHCLADEPQQMEFGVTLAPGHQGRGYAAEALDCLLEFAFATLGMHRVLAITGDQNLAAASLFRRLGFRQEAHHIEHRWYKGHWESELVFALLMREWELRAPKGP